VQRTPDWHSVSILDVTCPAPLTLINGCILYLLYSKKGSTVFLEPYQRVISATPHVKYRTPLYVWILLGIFLLFVAYVFVAFLSGPRGR
jgi:hypothetical protein